MPSDAAARALHDIAEHIGLAKRWTADLTLESFSEDRKTFYAVTRCVAIISEAVRRLPADVTARSSTLPWRKIRDAGNFYRHQYDDVAERDIWEVVKDDLPPLERFVETELSRP
jgi:uncharacterized protein with HEPN domain